MSIHTQIFAKHYSEGKPFIWVRIAVMNERTGQVTTFEQRCWVDTGFSGGIHVPAFRRSDAEIIGVKPKPTTVTLAGGVRRPGHVCLAFIQKIEDHEITSPGLEAELVMQGRSRYGLLGLEVLKNWVAKFDGPAEILSAYK